MIIRHSQELTLIGSKYASVLAMCLCIHFIKVYKIGSNTDRFNIMNPKYLITLKEPDFQQPIQFFETQSFKKKIFENVMVPFTTLLLTPLIVILVKFEAKRLKSRFLKEI